MPSPTRHPLPRAGLGLLSAAILALSTGSVALAGGGPVVTVEGGAYFDFVAPDPLGPTDGSIRFGFSGAPEPIAADADLVPPADTNLSFLGGGTPTCIAVTREGGVITRLEFVGECNVDGPVTLVEDIFGAGADGYLIADRVVAPAELVDGTPAFGALIGVPAAAGTILDLVFVLDVTTGVPTSFIGQTSVTGPVTLLAGGDIAVGAATLPNAVIDTESRGLLEDAAALRVEATAVTVGLGTIQQSGDPIVQIELTVSYTAPTPVPTPVPTAVPSADALPDTSAQGPSTAAPTRWLALVLVALAASWVIGNRQRRVKRLR